MASVWIVLGQALDVVDGWAARKMGAVTRVGAALDYQSDVVVTAALLAAAGAWGWIAGAVLLQVAAQSSSWRVSGRTAAAIFAVVEVAG